MIIGSGYNRDVGGSQGLGYTKLPWKSSYGIPVQTWLDLSQREQELWIQDLNRTSAQETYSEDSPEAYAFKYKDFVDNTADKTKDILNTGSEVALGLGLLAVAVVLGR